MSYEYLACFLACLLAYEYLPLCISGFYVSALSSI